MGWISRLSLFSIFILLQTVDIQAYNGAAWTNAETAEAVLKYFSEFLQYTELFTKEQMDEIKDIGDTITILMDQMVLMKKNSSAIFQALDAAFASSIAKLIAKEDQGESLNRKKSAVFDGFKAALKYVAGADDPAYLNEIRSLVSKYTDGLPINPGTYSSSQVVTSNFAKSEKNISSANVNVPDNLSTQQEFKVPSNYDETQNWSQQLLSQDKSFTGVSGLSEKQSLDLGNMQNLKSSNGADSSVADSDEINQFDTVKFESVKFEREQPALFSPLTTNEGTIISNQAQSTSDLKESKSAVEENILHEQKSLMKSIITPVGNDGQSNPISFGQSSSTVLLNDAAILSSEDEVLNNQSPKKKNEGLELIMQNDFQYSYPSYDYEYLVPKSAFSPNVANEGQTYPHSLGQISSAVSSTDTALISSGAKYLNYDSPKTKSDVTGIFMTNEYQNNPSYDYETPVSKSVVSQDVSNEGQTYPLSSGQISSAVFPDDTSLLSYKDEYLNYDSQTKNSAVTGLFMESDYQNSNPSYDYETSVPETVISVGVTNERQNYPISFGQSSSALLSNDTFPLSSGDEYLDDQSLRLKTDADGYFAGNDFQNREPNNHPQPSAYSVFVDSLSDELYYSDTFYEVFESDINVEEAVSTLISLIQSVSEKLGLNSLINEFEDAVYDHFATIRENADAFDYAAVFASAIGEILENNGIIKSETAENEAYTFADAIDLFIGTAAKKSSVSVFSNSDVDTQNHEKPEVHEYRNFIENVTQENLSPVAADPTTSKEIVLVPDVLSTAYRLYSESAIDRISSVVSKVSSMQLVNSEDLGLIASQLRNMISAKHPDLSGCETLHQVYSEILSALIHIVNANGKYTTNNSYIGESAAIVSDALKYLA